MKRYRVTAKTVEFPTIEIEAKNEQEAMDKANNTDGGDFEPDYNGSWEIISAEVIK